MSRHLLLTGHTGFKGSWLSALLAIDGFSVSGLSLDPKTPLDLFCLAEIHEYLDHDYRVDINDRDALRKALRSSGADTVLHLAAQPLVLEAYRNPLETFETNFMGTVNVLDAASRASCVDTLVVVTTDKVYANSGRSQPFGSDAPLGGTDPYSASKAAAEIAVSAWVNSFPGVRTATARAGNVIGGGDFAESRLIPDIAHALHLDSPLTLRYPNATRPWQHVLDCLDGYLHLVAHLSDQPIGDTQCTSWNFGPPIDSSLTVRELVECFARAWGKHPTVWEEHPLFKEADCLALDSSNSHAKLGWTNHLSSAETVLWTADWYRRYFGGVSPRALLEEQILGFRQLVDSPLK